MFGQLTSETAILHLLTRKHVAFMIDSTVILRCRICFCLHFVYDRMYVRGVQSKVDDTHQVL